MPDEYVYITPPISGDPTEVERVLAQLVGNQAWVKARLDAKSNAYVAELPSLGLRDVRIDDAVVRDNERMLTGGFYAEVDLFYDAAIADENNGKPFAIGSLRPIQLSTRDSLWCIITPRA